MIITDESDRRLDGEKHPRIRANVGRKRLCNHRREGLIWSEKWTASGKEKWFRSLVPINLALASATLIVAKRVASLLSRQKLGASHLALGGGCFRRRWRHPRRLPKSIGVFPKRTVRSDPLEQAAGLAPLIRDRVSTRCMLETMNENMPSTLSLLVHASDFNLACTNNRWPRVYALFETKFDDEYVEFFGGTTPCALDKEKYRDKGLMSRSRVRLFVRSNWKGYTSASVKAEQSSTRRREGQFPVEMSAVKVCPGGVLIERGWILRVLFVRVYPRSFCDVDEVVVVSMWMLLSAEVMRCLSARGWVFRVSLSDDSKVFRDRTRIHDFWLRVVDDSMFLRQWLFANCRIFVEGLFLELFCVLVLRFVIL